MSSSVIFFSSMQHKLVMVLFRSGHCSIVEFLATVLSRRGGANSLGLDLKTVVASLRLFFLRKSNSLPLPQHLSASLSLPLSPPLPPPLSPQLPPHFTASLSLPLPSTVCCGASDERFDIQQPNDFEGLYAGSLFSLPLPSQAADFFVDFEAYKGELGDYYCMAAKSVGLQCPDYGRMHEGFKAAYTNMVKMYPCFGHATKMPNIDWWRACVKDSFVKTAIFAAAGSPATGRPPNGFAGVQSLQPSAASLTCSLINEAVILQILQAGYDYDEETFEKVFRRIYSTFGSSAPYSVFPDSQPFMRWARKNGLVVGLVSNAEYRYQDVILPAFGLNKLIRASVVVQGSEWDFGVFSGVVGVEKPDRRIYEIALEMAGNVAADEVLHIGDSMRIDYLPARSVGMQAVLLDRFKTRDAEAWRLSGAPVFPDLVAVQDWLVKKEQILAGQQA
ncbi:hypothetical protein KSP40_PGU007368 [Platanthera guangdongensis]|uniref:Haloacid dehalogenase-like hydrolase domain-containing protein 3 n=1 Tax=Platanthera guangdongensis TaxID=2320717 RepID=A0ABR2MR50_9ASPA